MIRYFGISSTAWLVIFGAVSAASVSLGVTVGVSQLRSIRRQRASESLERLFEQWRQLSGDSRFLIHKMPSLSGANIVDRALNLAHYISEAEQGGKRRKNELLKLIATLRKLTRSLNDLGVFIERGVVVQEDFFRNYHTRLLEIVYLVEPFALLVSAASNKRWGLRLGRLRLAAEEFHRASALDAGNDVAVRGVVVLSGVPKRVQRPVWNQIRKRSFIPSSMKTKESVETAIKELRDLLIMEGDINLIEQILIDNEL